MSEQAQDQVQDQPQEAPSNNQITIQSYKFDVETRYSEGHALTENEASALQGLLQENVRNNFAKTIKSLVEQNEGKPLSDGQLEKVQKIFTKFVADYEFGKRRVAVGRTLNPLEKEVKRIAVEKLKQILADRGEQTWNETPADQRKALVARIVELNPGIVKLAEANLAQLQEIKL